MTGSAKILLLCAAALFSAVAASGALRVERGKITVGSAFRARAGQWAQFSCRLTNPDAKTRNLRIRLVPEDGFSGVVNELETTVPPRCAFDFSAPVITGNSEKYTFEIFEDGSRLPNSPEYSCIVKPVSARGEMVAYLNNGGETYGNTSENPAFKDFLCTTALNARNPAGGRAVLTGLRALVVAEPDFPEWTAEDFNAVLDYVRGGGTLVFSNPAGTLAAARTPLAELLPVAPLGVRSCTGITGIETLIPGVRAPVPDKELRFLDSVERGASGVTYARHEGFPLYREISYGRGRVKFLAFSPNPDHFPDDRATIRKLQARLLDDNRITPVPSALRAPLEHLTGFPVPRLGDIAGELGLYLGVLIATVGVLLWKKRPAVAWGAGVAIAIAATLLILAQAHRALGARGALAAELSIQQGNLTDRATSLYSPNECTLEIRGDGKFQPVPSGKRLPQSFGDESPLALRTGPDGAMRLAALNIPPRSSRLFRQTGNGGESQPETPAVAALTAGGKLVFRSRPPLPHPAPEAGFLVLPGGARNLSISGGSYDLAGTDTLFSDPLLDATREAVAQAHPAPQPYIAWILPLPEKSPDAGLPPDATRSGRRIVVQPVKLRVESEKLRLPTDFVRLFAPDHSARFMLSGSKFHPDHQLQPEMRVLIGAALPGWTAGFTPTGVTLRMRLAGAADLNVLPSLLLTDGTELRGQLRNGGEWHFTGEKLRRALDPATGEMVFALDSSITKAESSAGNNSILMWKILDFSPGVTGTLPAGRAPLTI